MNKKKMFLRYVTTNYFVNSLNHTYVEYKNNSV